MNTNNHTNIFDFYSDELDEDLQIKISFNLDIDNSYGADADGNRGVYMEFIEDLKVLGAYDESGQDKWFKLSPREREMIKENAKDYTDFDYEE